MVNQFGWERTKHVEFEISNILQKELQQMPNKQIAPGTAFHSSLQANLNSQGWKCKGIRPNFVKSLGPQQIYFPNLAKLLGHRKHPSKQSFLNNYKPRKTMGCQEVH